MNKLFSMFRKGSSCRGDTGKGQMVLCVKQVKQQVPEEWDEAMPLPGDIIEGLAEDDDVESQFLSVSGRTEFTSKLKKLGQSSEMVWVKVRRGETILKLRARVVSEKTGMLQRKYSIGADKDERHVAVVGDVDMEECSELQG